MNWLIILVTIAIFIVQLPDLWVYQTRQNPYIHDLSEAKPEEEKGIPGITGALLLDGWSVKGLLGYMWLHGGILHLLGNMWFLLVFGNAVCAKIGNLRYLLMYILFGVASGVVHLLFGGGPVLGASGAINGVVGMYLVLFPENGITCYFFFWFILYCLRSFVIRSFWMILFWLFWDIYGAFWGSDTGVAYFAHLGGFATGFGMAFLMCMKGWLTMERYEKSLLQIWQEYQNRPND
jgi:membrane associated rhomboid family serine protease